MFDLGSAVVLSLVLLGLVALANSLVDGTGTERKRAIICLAVALVAVLLVSASDFAHENVVLDRPLDSLNIWSQLIVALLASGLASGAWQIGAKAISKIGSPDSL